MFRMLLLGVGSAGVVGGLYILYLAFFRKDVFPKPERAKWEGMIATLVGIILLFWLFNPWQ